MTLRQSLILVGAVAAAALCVFALGLHMFGFWYDQWTNPPVTYANGCNVAVIPLQGDIVAYDPLPGEYNYVSTSGDDVEAAIKAADANHQIKGIELQIDSTGGSPAAGEQIMKALKNEMLPTAAYIREEGDSAGYLAATGADTIIADDTADVGDIGTTESYLQQTQQDATNGLQFISIASGPYKDALNPDSPITPTELAMAQQEVDDLAQIFIGEVAQNRHLATSTVQALADGSSMTAANALKNHLIDVVGDENTVQQWFTQKIITNAVLCESST